MISVGSLGCIDGDNVTFDSRSGVPFHHVPSMLGAVRGVDRFTLLQLLLLLLVGWRAI